MVIAKMMSAKSCTASEYLKMFAIGYSMVGREYHLRLSIDRPRAVTQVFEPEILTFKQ